MTDDTLRQALAYAARGWPVFPCQPGQKIPATTHGYRDATTDPGADHRLVRPRPECNLAIATGAPGPDVLDVDQHGPAGNGFAALIRLRDAGLLNGAAAYVRTPSGGLHAYFAGSRPAQRPPARAPPRLPVRRRVRPGPAVSGRRQALPDPVGTRRPRRPELGHGHPAPATPPHQQRRRQPQASGRDLGHLARWVAAQPEGNRNAGLFWAANRALETDPAADLEPARRRRPPGRPGRSRDHPHPGLRPPHRPAQPRLPGRSR